MIAFVSLFLGLIVGLEPVELLVDESVASVEIRLNGETIAELQGSPWSRTLDFGPELRPHELQAIAYDRDHQVVAQARQWVNLPRPPAEATVMLEGGDEGRDVIARLSWESVVASVPNSIDITFDGRPLTVEDPNRIRLPKHDPEQLHFLRAELDFSRNVSTVIEMVFGGSYADRLSVQLTAVPVNLLRGADLPSIDALGSRLSKENRPLSVVAAEKGPAEIVVVRDEGIRGHLNRIGRTSGKSLRRHARLGLEGRAAKSLRFKMSLPRDHQVRFLWPFSERRERERLDFDLLIPSQTFTSRDGGLYWLLTEYSPPASFAPNQRLTDAVAVAGLLAAGRNRRRAVLLVVGADARDTSTFSPQQVRSYLRQLRVPLFVWSPEPASASLREGWGAVADISSLASLEQAVKNLRRQLEQQRIVWVDGVHLPEDIILAPNPKKAGDLSLVR